MDHGRMPQFRSVKLLRNRGQFEPLCSNNSRLPSVTLAEQTEPWNKTPHLTPSLTN